MRIRLPCIILLISAFHADACAEEARSRKFSWAYLDLAYKHELTGNVKKGGKGFALESGLNAGRFFGKDFLITPYAGLGVLWGNSYTNSFLSDYSGNYVNITDAGTPLAEIVKAGGTAADIQVYYGVLFKLPYRYIPPIKIYRISDSLGIDSSGPAPGSVYNAQYGGGSMETLDRKGWGVETYLYSLWGNKKNPDDNYQTNIGYISIFYELLDFKNAQLSDYGSFSNHATASFMDKYSKEWKIGFKIGINVM